MPGCTFEDFTSAFAGDFHEAVFDVVRILSDGSIAALMYCIAIGIVGERYAVIPQELIGGTLIPIATSYLKLIGKILIIAEALWLYIKLLSYSQLMG